MRRLAASLIQMAISRTREYDADEDGSMLTEDPEALASALNKISNGAGAMPMQKTAGTQSVAAMMIANPFSSEGFSRLFSTHPATEDRIARLMQMSQEMKAQAYSPAIWLAATRQAAMLRRIFVGRMGVSLVLVRGCTLAGAIHEIIRRIPCKAGMVADRRAIAMCALRKSCVIA